MEVKISNTKLNGIAGQARSIYGYLIFGSGMLFMLLGAYRADFFALQITSFDAIWNGIRTEILLSTGIAMAMFGFFFNKGLLLNADMYGYLSRSKMNKILKNCETVEAKLVNKTTTKKVRRWFTPMTEYHFVLNNDNARQARYGSFDNELFKDDNSPATNIHKNEGVVVCKAYWNPEYPGLVVPVFLLED